MKRTIPAVLCLVLAGLLASQTAPPERVGPMPGGGFLLNTGWAITPPGTQIPLDTFPMSSALSKDGKFLLVLNAGYDQPSITVLDAKTIKPVGGISLPDAWLGMSFAPDGKTLYVGGGSQACVYQLSLSDDGQLKLVRTFPVVDPSKRQPTDFIGDVKVTPDGHLIYAAAVFQDAIVVINPQSGMVTHHWKTAHHPYRILFHPDGKTFFVTGWGDGSLRMHNTATGEQVERIPLGSHTTDVVWSARKPAGGEDGGVTWAGRLFVSAANTNKVLVLSVSDTKDIRMIGTLNVALHAVHPLGMTPSALALSPDESKLYVVCSDANAVAVADLTEPHTRLLGFVPTGSYPTAVNALPDGRLVVLNGGGDGSGPRLNAPGAQEQGAAGPRIVQAARQQKGSASVVPAFDETDLADYTLQVLRNSPYNDKKLFDAGVPPGNPVPTRPGEPTPIKYVIYVVKQSMAYDEVLGDLRKNGAPLGAGDAALSEFGEKITPNHHKLAREFVVFDNFYVNGEYPLDGEQWASAAIANDYAEKLSGYAYSGRLHLTEPYLWSDPPAGFLWTNAASAGKTVRNYGWTVESLLQADAHGRQVKTVPDSVLARYTDVNYRGHDLNYPDVERAKVFIAGLKEDERTGDMPQLTFLRLANDGTAERKPGMPSAEALVADNDAALGMVVEALSKSRFWPETAIFVVETSAESGADHVDSHRSVAYVISPYTRRGGVVDSTFYNTASALRSMELILSMRPMTHFDAGAEPMWAAFTDKPDASPYVAAPLAVEWKPEKR